MENAIKNIRFIHQLLMVVAAAMIAFGSASDPKKEDVKAAISELSTLQHLSFEDFCSTTGSKAIKAEGTRVVPSLMQQLDDRHGERKDIWIRFPFYCWQPASESSLNDYASFFAGTQTSLMFMQPTLTYSEIQTFRTGVNRLPTKLILAQVSSWLPGSTYSAKASSLVLSVPPSPRTLQGTLFLGYELRRDQTLEELMGGKPNGNQNVQERATFTAVPLVGQWGVQWLHERGQLYREMGGRTIQGRDEILSSLRRVWTPEIAALTPANAARVLEARLDTAPRAVSFFGVSVESSIAVWLGPVVATLVLLYFISHTKQLRMAVECGGELSRPYSWIGLFEDRVSTLLTYATLALFPTCGALLLVVREGDWRAPETLVT